MQFGKTWKMVPKPLRQVIVLVIGLTLIVIGGLLIVLPGPFTLPFVFAGLVVLAAEFVWAESILIRAKHHAKKVDPRKFLKKKKPPHEDS
jgi:drug/metabolite transporter (DMT)-like permease